jgi:hypothetical protein
LSLVVKHFGVAIVPFGSVVCVPPRYEYLQLADRIWITRTSLSEIGSRGLSRQHGVAANPSHRWQFIPKGSVLCFCVVFHRSVALRRAAQAQSRRNRPRYRNTFLELSLTRFGRPLAKARETAARILLFARRRHRRGSALRAKTRLPNRLRERSRPPPPHARNQGM